MVATPALITISLFRHGDRTFLEYPHRANPHDPDVLRFINENGGYGQLTKEGYAQEATLGKAIKERYFAGNETKYSRDFVYVRSSGYDRTLLSVQAQLGAMWKEPPFPPVHSVNGKSDGFFRGYDTTVCPRMSLTDANEIEEKVSYAADDVLVARAHKLESKLGYTPMEEKQLIQDAHKILDKRFRAIAPVAGAMLINEILRILTAVSSQVMGWSDESPFDLLMGFEDRLRDPKLILYSAHDMTLMALLHILKSSDKVFYIPPYASSLVFEMDPNYCIAIWYNEGVDTLFTQKLNLVKKPCMTVDDLKLFVGTEPLYNSYETWETECEGTSIFMVNWAFFAVSSSGCLAILLLLLIRRCGPLAPGAGGYGSLSQQSTTSSPPSGSPASPTRQKRSPYLGRSTSEERIDAMERDRYTKAHK